MLGTVDGSGDIVDNVDIIEINHVYSEGANKPYFVQFIFYKWSDTYRTHSVVAWRMVREHVIIRRNGKITITLSETDSQLLLKVCDDGVGFDGDTGIKGTGFGTQLVKLLTKQLDGNMALITSRGTEVIFEFQISKAA
jgi:glucose-6-phosphate-specific signal transduction histidine kinase